MLDSEVLGQIESSGTTDTRRARLKNSQWINEQLKNAMNAVTDQGMKLRAASRVFGVPATLLRDHLYGTTITRQRGNKSTLKPDKEQKLVDYVFKMQDLGHPLIPTELRLKVALAT